MRSSRVLLCLLAVCCWFSSRAQAGGPILVGGPALGNRPAYGVDGRPFTWDPSKMPISYRVDPGPMAVTPQGGTVVDHAAGLRRIQSMLGVWTAVPTAQISFTNAGNLLPAGTYSSGDLKTVQQFNDVMGSCQSGKQNPVIFDADGKIVSGLGLSPDVIGFNSSCAVDTTTGYITASAIVLNGQFQDGVSTASPLNYELDAAQFDEAITHEIGHFLGLDHSQINLDLLLAGVYPCEDDGLAGLPLMFPIAACQARADAGFPVLAPDDAAWISSLYPNASTVNSYGTISGVIYFSDGLTPVQGVNVIARLVDDPNTQENESRRVAVSAVSGYLFTGNPGQSVSAGIPQAPDNTNGSTAGSRNPQLIGYYEMQVPPGTYTVEVESVYDQFTAGSSVGPLDPPISMPGPPEFWNQNESAFDFLLQRDPVTVHAGDHVTGVDIILNQTIHRFDQYEDSGALFDSPLALPESTVKDMSA
ncbi:MAG: hypothetical protein JST79_01150 [Acidobacteria bacterium]|nr:hypothetical protein [Acidobacteriota bacterium]